jgi:signal transduction histidine kinase
MRWPLHRQIVWPQLLVAAASLAAVSVFNASQASKQTRAEVERRLRGVAAVLSNTNFPLTDAVLQNMRDLCGAELLLVDGRGRIVASSWTGSPPLLPAAEAGSPAELSLETAVRIGERSFLHTVVPQGERNGVAAGSLHILFPREYYLLAWRRAFLPSVAVGLVVVASAAIMARRVAGRVSRTTQRLGREVRRLATGDFGPIVAPQLDDELLDLTVSVNQTAEMLAQYERQVRRAERLRTAALLGAGLAHELRNSATGCRLALDLHRESCPGESADESLVVARRQLQLMEGLLQRFLSVGAPAESAPRVDVDLGEMLAEVLALAEPTAKHGCVALHWTVPAQPLVVRGDPQTLNQAVLNLVLNAIDAARRGVAPEGSAVRAGDLRGAAQREVGVVLRGVERRWAELEVGNTGPAPKADIAESLFEPFVTSKPEGAGLGLALVRQTAADHGGAAEWERVADRTIFRLRLPVTDGDMQPSPVGSESPGTGERL